MVSAVAVIVHGLFCVFFLAAWASPLSVCGGDRIDKAEALGVQLERLCRCDVHVRDTTLETYFP